MTPGTQPQSHSKNVIKIEPQPLSKTAKGGQIIDIKTRQILINLFFDCDVIYKTLFPEKSYNYKLYISNFYDFHP